MYIALLAFEILVASRGVLGSVIGRDSLIKNLHGRDVQSTVISAVSPSPITLLEIYLTFLSSVDGKLL